MKGLLLSQGKLPPWTDDLVELTSLLEEDWNEAVASEEELEKLTIFEVAGRY